MRGYGQTGQPQDIDQYTLFHLVGDMLGVLDALSAPEAVVVGHDWGAPVAWHCALLLPDRFRAVAGLSVPFVPRGSKRPTSVMPQTELSLFYQLYFQAPGVAEAELERSVFDLNWNWDSRIRGDFDSTCWLDGGQQECRSRIRKTCATG